MASKYPRATLKFKSSTYSKIHFEKCAVNCSETGTPGRNIANVLTAGIKKTVEFKQALKVSLIIFIFNLSSLQNHEVPCRIKHEVGCLFIYGSFTVQWKVLILAAKRLLSSTERVRARLFLEINFHQNRQFIAEMFFFYS